MSDFVLESTWAISPANELHTETLRQTTSYLLQFPSLHATSLQVFLHKPNVQQSFHLSSGLSSGRNVPTRMPL